MRPAAVLGLAPGARGTGRPLVLALLLLAACQTAAPRPGQPRAAYPRYGVQQLDVVVLAVSGPEAGSDEDMQVRSLPPPALGPQDALELADPAAAELSWRYARALCERLQGAGFQAHAVHAEASLPAQRERAGARGSQAVLLVRYRWVDRVTLGRTFRVRVPVHKGRRDLRAPTSTELDVDAPEPFAALLLPSSVQLIDVPSGLQLYRGPSAGVDAGDVLRSDSAYVRWGVVAPADAGGVLDADEAVRRAARLAVGGLRPGAAPRDVDEDRAAALAALEPLEARAVWLPALLVGGGFVRFPVALDLGPATAQLPDGAPRRFVLVQDHPAELIALAAGLELGYRDERLLALLQLRESAAAGSSGRTYLRTDDDTRRGFPVQLGPLHDLSLQAMAGQQRLLRPWLGLRAAAGPALHWHLIQGTVPPGATLGGLNLALGGAALIEPFVAVGPLELGLRLQTGLAYDLAGGVLGEGGLLLRAGIVW